MIIYEEVLRDFADQGRMLQAAHMQQHGENHNFFAEKARGAIQFQIHRLLNLGWVVLYPHSKGEIIKVMVFKIDFECLFLSV